MKECNMKLVKFTKASKHDTHKVTVNASSLFNTNIAKNLPKGTTILADINGVTTVLRVNRAGRTLSTNAFPSKLQHPIVGCPIKYAVTNVRFV